MDIDVISFSVVSPRLKLKKVFKKYLLGSFIYFTLSTNGLRGFCFTFVFGVVCWV